MRTRTESFVSEIILSPTYNNQTGGDVESPSHYYGTMHFEPNDFVVDGMDTPTEFLGRSVVATISDTGLILYLTTEDQAEAQSWFEAQEERYANWFGED